MSLTLTYESQLVFEMRVCCLCVHRCACFVLVLTGPIANPDLHLGPNYCLIYLKHANTSVCNHKSKGLPSSKNCTCVYMNLRATDNGYLVFTPTFFRLIFYTKVLG